MNFEVNFTSITVAAELSEIKVYFWATYRRKILKEAAKFLFIIFVNPLPYLLLNLMSLNASPSGWVQK